MHGILQGTAPVVIHHCLQAIAQTGFEVHQFLERYYQLWQYPKGHKCQYIHTLFQKKNIEKNKKAQKFSCTASECLAIFPVMRHFLETIIQPQGLCPKEVKSFLAMALVIDQCHGGIQWKTTTRSSLLAAVEDCNQSFSEAFPEATMIRKWHWHLHLPDSYGKFGHLPSCFTCERKHKTMSSFASRLLKTQSFEANLLEQLLANEISTLKEPNLFPAVSHLTKEKNATAKEIAGIQIHSGDAIVYSNGDSSSTWNLAQVLFHAHVFGMATTLVQLWTIDALEKHHATCHLGESMGLIPMDNILFPVPYNKDNSKAIVLLPYQIHCQT